ncbi:MAG: MFS transporter [Actinomycetota bacterium]
MSEHADGIAEVGEPQRRSWCTRTLVVLTLVSFFQDAASDLVYPLLPIFLTGVLAAPPVLVGVIEGVADATAGVTKFFAGKWSDRRGRKPFIAYGYGIAAVGKVLVASSVAWPMVLLGRVSDRFGKGLRSAPRDALIAADTPPESLGRAFGFHRAGDSLGAVVGPLIGLLALSVVHGNVRSAMWWAIVPAVISTALVAFVRDRRPPVPNDADGGDIPVERAPDTAEPLPRPFWLATLAVVIIALVNFSDALLLLRVVQLGYSTTQVVLAYVVFNSVYTLASYPAGALADRMPRSTVYAIGLVAFAAGYLGLGLLGRGIGVFVVIGVYGLFPAFTDGVGKAWVASLVPRERAGRAQGVFQALNNGAVLVAGLWAGLLWNVGPGHGVLPLLVAGSAAAVAAMVLPLLPI